MDKLAEHAIRMLEIVEGENDFFRNDEKRQADIARAVYDIILRVQMLEQINHKAEQTEPSDSEKPNNSTISKMETQNSNLTFEKRTMRDCYNCKRYETEGECIECNFEPKDETTERQRLEGKRWTDALTIEEKKQLLDGWIVDESQTERSE